LWGRARSTRWSEQRASRRRPWTRVAYQAVGGIEAVALLIFGAVALIALLVTIAVSLGR
jgi:hypothetical protein